MDVVYNEMMIAFGDRRVPFLILESQPFGFRL